jgi:hypothetical protein
VLSIPKAAQPLISALSVAFTRPTFQCVLFMGAVLSLRRRTVTAMLRAVGPLDYENVPLGDVRMLTAAQSRWLLAASKGLTPAQIAAFEARVGVPEPASPGLLGAGAIGLLSRRRRR